MPKKQTSIQDKRRIYEAHKRGEDPILLGRQLGIKEHTVRAMIKTISARDGKLSVQQGGSHHCKVTPQMRIKIKEILSENCALSVREINERLQNALPNEAKISCKTIERLLDGMFYTRLAKKFVIGPQEIFALKKFEIRKKWRKGNSVLFLFKATQNADL